MLFQLILATKHEYRVYTYNYELRYDLQAQNLVRHFKVRSVASILYDTTLLLEKTRHTYNWVAVYCFERKWNK